MKNTTFEHFSRSQNGNVRTLMVLATLLLAVLAGLFTYRATSYDFHTLDDQKHRWSELKGDWVVINYFAKWCAPCLREVPELNRFYTTVQEQNIAMFMVSYDPLSETQLSDVVTEYDIKVPVIVSTPDLAMPNQHPRFLPATYIVNPQGEVAAELFGEQTAQSLTQIIEELRQRQSS